ncbi:MAG: VWA domain-containing protein [Rivularia sp. (in: Bacteria)]|nr:VWA domain-containing protein [Rivularia sp. MS3]
MLDLENVNPYDDAQYNFAYLIDVSDSVGEDTLKDAKDAYIQSIQSLIDRGIADVSEFAVIPFGSDASLHGALDATEAISKIKSLSGKNGFTNFNAALEKANQFYSQVPSGGQNIVYFLSDGYSTIGGSFKESADALHKVADVRAYGVGAAQIQDLRIIDSNEPVIVNKASQLASRFVDDMGGLVADKSQNTDSQGGGNEEIEVASAPVNEAVQQNSSDTKNEPHLGTPKENLVDDSVSQTPTTSIKPGIDNRDNLGVGGNIDGLIDAELPIVNVEDVSIEEGDIGTSMAQFVVNLSSPATEEIQFSYQTVDGTATSGSDYNQASGQITIPIGETKAEVDIIVNGDREIELDEEFTLNLKNLTSATFANNQTEYNKVAVIENDDVAQSSAIIPQNEAQSPPLEDNTSLLEGNLMDLQSFTDEVTINFTVDRKAIYDNTVGFYKINDIEGTITDPVTGEEVKPSDGEAYAKLAIELREKGLEFSVGENQSSITSEDSLLGGILYAPFIVADGEIDSLEGDFSQVFFSFAQANSDKAEHIRSLGNNTFGFEDMLNGGDNDFNDIIIQTEVKTI